MTSAVSGRAHARIPRIRYHWVRPQPRLNPAFLGGYTEPVQEVESVHGTGPLLQHVRSTAHKLQRASVRNLHRRQHG